MFQKPAKNNFGFSLCRYKIGIKNAKRKFEQERCDRIHNDLVHGNNNQWRRPLRVDPCTQFSGAY